MQFSMAGLPPLSLLMAQPARYTCPIHGPRTGWGQDVLDGELVFVETDGREHGPCCIRCVVEAVDNGMYRVERISEDVPNAG